MLSPYSVECFMFFFFFFFFPPLLFTGTFWTVQGFRTPLFSVPLLYFFVCWTDLTYFVFRLGFKKLEPCSRRCYWFSTSLTFFCCCSDSRIQWNGSPLQSLRRCRFRISLWCSRLRGLQGEVYFCSPSCWWNALVLSLREKWWYCWQKYVYTRIYIYIDMILC